MLILTRAGRLRPGGPRKSIHTNCRQIFVHIFGLINTYACQSDEANRKNSLNIEITIFSVVSKNLTPIHQKINSVRENLFEKLEINYYKECMAH